MKNFKLENFTRGWLIGDFEPNVIKTDQFEFSVKKYEVGDEEAKHYHKITQEISVIVSGKFEMNGKILEEGDITLLEPGEVAKFKCLESGQTAVIKIPSIKNDKFIIN
jgi:quercetin dioxygenase-like cupin family protein